MEQPLARCFAWRGDVHVNLSPYLLLHIVGCPFADILPLEWNLPQVKILGQAEGLMQGGALNH